MELLLKIGGIYNILCALLHVMFPKILGWQTILALTPEDRRPFVEQPLHIMNWCMVVFWLILSYIPIVYSHELMTSPLGKTLLGSIVIFWLVRIFILQPVYIGLKDPASRKMIGFFLIGLILFAAPLIAALI